MNQRRFVKKLVIGMMALVFLGANAKAMAEEAAETRKLSILSVKGENGSVVKGGTREIRAAAGMRLGQGAKVKTGAASQIYLEADNDKVMKLDSSSMAEITGASSKKLKITLKSGSLFFNVDRKLAEDEELTFDAAQTSMSIRGTGGLISFQEGNLVFSLAEGSVDWQIGNETVHVEAGEQVVLHQVKNGEELEQNGMNSVYELQVKKELDWQELDAFGLETMIELVQDGRLDATAIGYDQAADGQKARELLEIKQEEKRQEEEKKQKQAEEQKEKKENNGGRQDGRPPAEKSDGAGGSRIGAPVRGTEAETTEEETTEAVSTSTEPETTGAVSTPTEPGAPEDSSTDNTSSPSTGGDSSDATSSDTTSIGTTSSDTTSIDTTSIGTTSIDTTSHYSANANTAVSNTTASSANRDTSSTNGKNASLTNDNTLSVGNTYSKQNSQSKQDGQSEESNQPDEDKRPEKDNSSGNDVRPGGGSQPENDKQSGDNSPSGSNSQPEKDSGSNNNSQSNNGNSSGGDNLNDEKAPSSHTESQQNALIPTP